MKDTTSASAVPLDGIAANIFELVDDDNGNANNKLIAYMNHNDLKTPPADLEYTIYIRATKTSDNSYVDKALVF